MGTPTQGKICVLLADDHAEMRDAVERILGPSFDVMSVLDGDALVEEAEREKPDLMIVDISMPKMSGIDAIKALQQRVDEIAPTVVCSMHRDSALVNEAVQAGVQAYVYKARAPFELREAVEAVLENRQFFSPEVAEAARLRTR